MPCAVGSYGHYGYTGRFDDPPYIQCQQCPVSWKLSKHGKTNDIIVFIGIIILLSYFLIVKNVLRAHGKTYLVRALATTVQVGLLIHKVYR